jgi:short-subunit dehydrogenase
MDLRGAICLVTGASSGIGRATVDGLGAVGAMVIASGRDRSALEEVAARTGCSAIVTDLADPSQVDRLASEALGVHGRVDVLINNAGIGWTGRFADMDPSMADRIIRVNLLAPTRLTRALLPQMLSRRRGHVVNVASVAGHVGVGREAAYAAAKGGLITFSESLRYDLRGSGVGVTVVSPGIVDTPFFERRGGPVQHRFPRAVAPHRVAEAMIRAVERGRPQVFIPRWLAFPPWLRGTLPGLYRALQSRFG